MKKALIILASAAALFVSCKDNGNQQPDKKVFDTIEEEWRDSVQTALKGEYENQVLTDGTHNMKLWWKVYGSKPADGRSLYISLHGGGGTAPSVNDGQWDNQKVLYTPAEGVYLCPRAITDTWDLHFRPESDGFYERIIQMAVAYLDVNPNKVYVMGYSAGGDGVWRIAPRMADHWAAASMMAGHPGDVSLLSLRNTPFMIWCGENDSAYDRNKECAKRIEEMDALQAADPEGYVHEGHIVPGREHWMYLEDAAAVPWMAKYTRNPYPKKVVWCQGDVMKEYFYWLGIPLSEARKGSVLRAEIADNVITITESDYSDVRIYLNDSLVDLSKPVKVVYNGKVYYEGMPEVSEDLRRETLFTRNDLSYCFPCCVEVPLDGMM